MFITQRFCSFKFRSTSLREARHRWSLWEFCSTYLDPLASGRLDDYQQAITKWALNLDPLASGRLDGKMLKKLRSWITQFRSTSLREARQSMVLITSRYCCYLDPLASGRLDGFSGDTYPLSTDLDPLASGRLDITLQQHYSMLRLFRSTSLREARLDIKSFFCYN